jgi:hypothetical protein
MNYTKPALIVLGNAVESVHGGSQKHCGPTDSIQPYESNVGAYEADE